jgi:hypothetical protein
LYRGALKELQHEAVSIQIKDGLLVWGAFAINQKSTPLAAVPGYRS